MPWLSLALNARHFYTCNVRRPGPGCGLLTQQTGNGEARVFPHLVYGAHTSMCLAVPVQGGPPAWTNRHRTHLSVMYQTAEAYTYTSRSSASSAAHLPRPAVGIGPLSLSGITQGAFMAPWNLQALAAHISYKSRPLLVVVPFLSFPPDTHNTSTPPVI